MNKEDILQKAREEGKGIDLSDIDAQKKGTYIAYMVGIIVILIWNIVEQIVYNKINYGGNMVIHSMLFTVFLVKYIKLKKKHELMILILYGFATIIFLVLWILQLIGVI